MVGENQASVTFPSKIIERLDKFLKTDKAKDMGYSSRPTVVVPLLREFLDKHLPFEEKQEAISLIGFTDNTIVLKENDTNLPVILSIGKDKILKCSLDNDPNCKHRNFCLQNETLWEFLKEHDTKVTRVRE